MRAGAKTEVAKASVAKTIAVNTKSATRERAKRGRVRMSNGSYDVVVIGGGPGGYPAAIRARQLGLSVALIERERFHAAGTRGEVGRVWRDGGDHGA